jgi:hypothetical protein
MMWHLNGRDTVYLWTRWCQCLCAFQFRTKFKSLGRDSAVGIATRYGLDGPGIESRWGTRFYAPVQTGPGAHPASYKMGTWSFPGVKQPGRGVDHPPPSRSEVKEESSFTCTLSLWAFVACYRVNFTSPLPYQLQKQDRLTKTDKD